MLATLILGQRSALADEPVKLAMVTQSTTVSTNAVKVAPKVTNPNTNYFSATFSQHPTAFPTSAALHPTESAVPTVAVTALLKKRPTPAGFFTSQPGNGNFGFANIEAGYGQAYDCDSVVLRGNNGTPTEETRYIFFKKVVKF